MYNTEEKIMSKPKLDRKVIEARANESKDARFRRIANPRIKKVRYELGRLTNMVTQPNYTVLDVDAQKMLDVVRPDIERFLDLYDKLAHGQTIKTNKKEIEDVF